MYVAGFLTVVSQQHVKHLTSQPSPSCLCPQLNPLGLLCGQDRSCLSSIPTDSVILLVIERFQKRLVCIQRRWAGSLFSAAKNRARAARTIYGRSTLVVHQLNRAVPSRVSVFLKLIFMRMSKEIATQQDQLA